MRVEWAFVCRTLGVRGEEAAAEGIGADRFVRPLPTKLALVVLARLAALEIECGRPHRVESFLTGPEFEAIESRSLSVTLDTGGPEHPEGWEVKSFLPIIVWFGAERAGTYALDTWIDGRFRWQVPFRVLAA